ncbi:ankyrin repeat-containing domain protein [Pyronema omphalodes]|nr:ankyrin repeat-containing domain protein [Pyronema omphalodes]
MTSEQPDPTSLSAAMQALDSRVIDPATPLPPRCRTFRLSEIPADMNNSTVRQFLDSLQVGAGSIKGNSTVFSLATYRSWQVATVSFHQEPEEFKICKPGHTVYLPLPKKRFLVPDSSQERDRRIKHRLDHPERSQSPEHQMETRAAPVRVAVDCDFYAMTPLYASLGMTARYDVIAVTGLSAHAFGSWKSPDQADRMWLRDFLPQEFPDIRVFTWGYYSSIRNNESKTSITALARNFLEDIKRVREKETISRPLILIGHSLGGLVLQKALVEASKGHTVVRKAFHQSCIGVLFFGVPHQGLNRCSIEMLVQGKENEHFLRDISTGSDYLFELDKEFRMCHGSMRNATIVSFYESEDTRSVETFANGEAKRCGAPIRMVPRESAICSLSQDYNKIEIRADHSRMVKFRSQSDEHYQRVVTMIQDIKETHEMIGRQQRFPENEMRQIMSFISPLEPHKRHQDIRQKRLEGTGDWFLRESAFQKWSDMESESGKKGSVLACSGIPGAGNSLVFDHLGTKFSSDETACVTCIYCDYQDDKEQTPVNMIGVLLNQVIATLNDSGKLHADTISALKRILDKQKYIDLKEACRLFRDIVKDMRRFYICIDALDECSEAHRRGFVQALAKVASECNRPSVIRIFFTTRPHIKWEDFIKTYINVCSLDHMYLKAHAEDIRRYVFNELELDENGDCMDERLRTEILDKIVANSDEMFLLPTLQIQTVLDQTTISKRRKALYSMPTQLDTAFGSTITRIKNQKPERVSQAMEVLKWTFLARRPLKVIELRHALSVNINTSKMKPGQLTVAYDQTLDWDNFPSEKSLIDWCLGLIILDAESSTVRLVHKSLHDYLTQLYDDGKIFPNGHSEIAYTCLQYMCFNDDKHPVHATQERAVDHMNSVHPARFSLLNYAIENFPYHLRDDSRCTVDMIHAFFPDRINLNCISAESRLKFLAPFYGWRDNIDGAPENAYISISQIHLRLQFAISYGLKNVFVELLDACGLNIDYDTTLSGSTMLLQACRAGNAEIVRILLERGVDVNLPDGKNGTPLSWACHHGHDSVVELLLQASRIEINSKHEFGRTALLTASEMGNVSLVKLLLQSDSISINARDYNGRTALSWAAWNGHDSVVRLLLQTKTIDENSKDWFGRTALSLASGNGNESTVKLLLRANGIDVNSKDSVHDTALLRACKNGHYAVVKLLLQHEGIDINAYDRDYHTALSWTSENSHLSFVKLLLKADSIDVNQKVGSGHIAPPPVHYGLQAAVLDPPRDIGPSSCNSRTASSRASETDYASVIHPLRRDGIVDGNSRDRYGQTTLSLVSGNGNDLVVKLLLEANGIDINAKDSDGNSPLSRACKNGHYAVVKLLIQHEGIDINATDSDGHTALSWASKNGRGAVVTLLLEADSIDVNQNIESGDIPPYSDDLIESPNDCNTALSLACEYGHHAVVQLLLQVDRIDINLRCYQGWTALALTAVNGYDSIVELLLQADGIEINSEDQHGNTALALAVFKQHDSTAQLLSAAGGIHGSRGFREISSFLRQYRKYRRRH